MIADAKAGPAIAIAWTLVAVALAPRGVSAAERAHDTRIYLDGGEDDPDLRRTLIDELPAGTLVTSTTAADLRLTVRRSPDAIVVELDDGAGQSATRRFAFAEGDGDAAEVRRDAALRRVVLLATRAQLALADVFAEKNEPPPAERSGVRAEAEVARAPAVDRGALVVSAGWAFVWWRTPFRAEPGPTLVVARPIGDFDVGVRLVAGGLPSSARSANGISGDAIEIAVLAEAAFELVSAGPMRVRVDAGLGANWIRVDVRGRGLGAPGDASPASFSVQRFTRVEGIGRLGPSIELAIGGFATVWAGGGAEARLPRTRVALPPGYPADSLDSGRLVPFAQAGLGARF
jgi:hypothetical protein